MSDQSSKIENYFSSALGKTSPESHLPLADSMWLKLFWPGMVLLFFIISTVFAFNQSPRLDPWQPVNQFSANWFFHPEESNAFKRLPIISGDINDVFTLPEGSDVWAVGDGELILHSSDGGQHWQQQHPLIPQQKDLSKKEGNRFIPNAYAMNAGYSNVQVQQAVSEPQKLRPVDAPLLKQGKLDARKKKLAGKEPRRSKKNIEGRKAPQQEKLPLQADAELRVKAELPKQSANLFDIYFVDRNQGWAVGAKGTILSTSDGGKSWHTQSYVTKYMLTSIAFGNAGNRGWAVGGAGVILSTSDGGQSWHSQSIRKTRMLNSVTFDRSGKRGWSVGNNGTILVTSNGGKSWNIQESGTGSLLRSVAFESSGNRGWAVGQDGVILASSDGGASWYTQESGTKSVLRSVAFERSGNRGWAVGQAGIMLATSDGGASWHRQSSGTKVWLNSVTFDRSGNRGWAVGGAGTILATNDGGKTWYPQSISADSPIMMDADGIHGWKIARNNTVSVTDDGGKEWHREPEPYSMGPAPWYLISVVLCLLLLAYLSPRLIREMMRGRGQSPQDMIINKSVTDRPAGPGSPDYLGALKVARGLARFISNRHTTPPVTLAITGDWGSGKSSVMNYLFAQLRRDGLKPVWFNAWHHREEGNVLASMLENVRRQAIPKTPYGFYIRLRLLLKRHWVFKLASVALLFGGAYISVNIFTHAEKQDAAWHYALYTIGVEQPVALSRKSIETFCKKEIDVNECQTQLLNIKWNPSKKNTQVLNGENHFSTHVKLLDKMKQLLQREFSKEEEKAALKAAVHPSPELPFAISSTVVSFIGTLFGLITLLIVKGASIVGVGTTGIIQKTLRMAGFERSKEPIGTRQLFERQFRQITDIFGKRRLVIFIDDLDRCEKDYTMKVLETTNFLASSGELFMVLGMAPRYVLANVNLHFAALAEAVHEVERDNNHASLNTGEALPSRASFARRYLQKLINIEVPVPKGDEKSTRNMLLGKAGEVDVEGKLEMQRLSLFSRARKYAWFGIVIGVVALAWQLATDQGVSQQHQINSEQPSTRESQPASIAVREKQQKEIILTDSVSRFTPANPVQRNVLSIVIPSVLVTALLLLLFLVWRYRDKREKLIAMFKPLGIAIAGPEQTEDSENFSEALGIWNEVIFNANPNPRKIKVFLNHLRYVSSQMVDESGGHEAHLVAIAVMHYVFGKDIESLDRQNLMAAATYQDVCSPEMVEDITKLWSDHQLKFDSLPDENHWQGYLKFIRNVEIHQPHH